MADSNYGVLLKKGANVVGEVTNLEIPELGMEAVEATNHSSGGWREYIPNGLMGAAEFSATCNAEQTTISGFYTDMAAKTEGTYTIDYAAGLSDWTFNAIVVSIKVEDADAQNPDVLKLTAKFQPTGSVTGVA